MLRLGIVGVGFGARVHLPAFRSIASCEVTAICAGSRDRAAAAAKRLDVARSFGDWRDLIASPEIDAIAMAVPPAVQETIARAALERGLPVFCEKPLARTEEDAEILAKTAFAASVANMVDFEFPDLDLWRQVKTLLAEGRLGRLRHVQVSWNVETASVREGTRSWKSNEEEGGGTLSQFACHVFHYLDWLLGPIESISARLFPPSNKRQTGDALVSLTLTGPGGLPIVVTVSAQSYLGGGHRLECFGNDGTLVLENPTADYVTGFRLFLGTRNAGRLDLIAADPLSTPPAPDGRINAVARVASRFVAWIRGGPAAHPDFGDGLRVQRLISASQRSAAAGGRAESLAGPD